MSFAVVVSSSELARVVADGLRTEGFDAVVVDDANHAGPRRPAASTVTAVDGDGRAAGDGAVPGPVLSPLPASRHH